MSVPKSKLEENGVTVTSTERLGTRICDLSPALQKLLATWRFNREASINAYIQPDASGHPVPLCPLHALLLEYGELAHRNEQDLLVQDKLVDELLSHDDLKVDQLYVAADEEGGIDLPTSPLCLAMRHKTTESAKKLLLRNADVNAGSANALELAIGTGDIELISMILERGLSPEYSEISSYIINQCILNSTGSNSVEIVRLLNRAGISLCNHELPPSYHRMTFLEAVEAFAHKAYGFMFSVDKNNPAFAEAQQKYNQFQGVVAVLRAVETFSRWTTIGPFDEPIGESTAQELLDVLEEGASFSQINADGDTPWHQIVHYQNSHMYRFALNHTPSRLLPALFATRNRVRRDEKIDDCGNHYTNSVLERDTVLHLAIAHHRANDLTFLFTHTPRHLLPLLLAAKNEKGETALDFALSSNALPAIINQLMNVIQAEIDQEYFSFMVPNNWYIRAIPSAIEKTIASYLDGSSLSSEGNGMVTFGFAHFKPFFATTEAAFNLILKGFEKCARSEAMQHAITHAKLPEALAFTLNQSRVITMDVDPAASSFASRTSISTSLATSVTHSTNLRLAASISTLSANMGARSSPSASATNTHPSSLLFSAPPMDVDREVKQSRELAGQGSMASKLPVPSLKPQDPLSKNEEAMLQAGIRASLQGPSKTNASSIMSASSSSTKPVDNEIKRHAEKSHLSSSKSMSNPMLFGKAGVGLGSAPGFGPMNTDSASAGNPSQTYGFETLSLGSQTKGSYADSHRSTSEQGIVSLSSSLSKPRENKNK